MTKTERDDWESLIKFKMEEVSGRARVSLQNILPLLETAHDFASLEPPRPVVVIERLEMAIMAIKKEIECLRGEQAWQVH